MPGYQEILIISAIVLAVIFIPRVRTPREPARQLARSPKKLSGKWRTAIAFSFVYPVITAGVMQPWRRDAVSYLYFGLGPILFGWLVFWVLRGFSRK